MDGGGQRLHADGSAGKVLDDHFQDLPVKLVQPQLVNIQPGQRFFGDLQSYFAVAFNLGEVADPPQQAVGDPGGAARAFGDLIAASLVHFDVEELSGVPDDLFDLGRIIIFQPVDDAEPVAERGRELANAGRRSDQRELGEIEPDGAGAWPLADDDIECEIFHCRIEDLLDHPVQTVDLVDEQDIVRFKIGQNGCQVARPFNCRAGGDLKIDPHLIGDDRRQSGLAQTGRAVKEEVLQMFPAGAGGVKMDLQVFFELGLADKVLESFGPQAFKIKVFRLAVEISYLLHAKLDYNTVYVTIQFMPELRQNPATKEWVIIATERAKRPEEFGSGPAPVIANHRETCPFCVGNENMTPPEIMAYRTFGTAPNTPGWWIRIVPNQFPALEQDGAVARQRREELFVSMPGIGEHEVLIESTDHAQVIATMDQNQVEEIFLAYRERYRTLSKDPRFEMIIIFKNHGVRAGTSLAHPHSQIIAAPITPMHIRHRIEEAMRYFDDNGECVYCRMIAKEQKLKERVVMETDNFIVIEPFASASPFETVVFPKKHASTFDAISSEHCRELAFVMKQTLAKLHKALNNPDYNYVIFSSPCHERDLEYYHWYILIYPRVTSAAGFELGSGIFINTVIPEKAAEYLRATAVG